MEDISTIFLMLAKIFCLLYFMLMLWFIHGWNKLPEFNAIPENPATRVSVIIPARNEEDNIAGCLACIAKQDYPRHLFEIIVADDNSIDSTVSECLAFFNAHPEIHGSIVNVSAVSGSKKAAIELGLTKATGKLIVTTDADCRMKSGWLRTIAAYYEVYKPKLIACPVCIDSEQSVLEKIQSLEFLGLTGVACASFGNGKPILCNGANLAFEKEAFENVSGYSGNKNIASGDDIFLLYKINKAFSGQAHFLKSKRAAVYTKAKETFSQFIEQRKRWTGKSISYHDPAIAGIGILVYMTNFSIALTGFLSIIFYPYFSIAPLLLIFGTKCLIDFLFLNLPAGFFKRRDLLLYFFRGQLFVIIYTIFILPLSMKGGYTWKGRKIER